MTDTNISSTPPEGDDATQLPHSDPKNNELQGLDPKELMAKGLRSEVANTPSIGGVWQPPKVEELAEQFPRFKLIELLGRGGMGAVYKAQQTGLDRMVAIKVLPPQASEDVQFAERFSREAKALAMLNHPHIVTVYDFGETIAGMFFIVMEYVDGSDLRHAIRSGKINPQTALKIVPQVCDALQYAHSKGLIHRDIKPENILLECSGNVKIADFGLARLLGSEIPEWTLTATEQVMGTLKYMAPEQVEGARGIDHRADIYSLGVVFYEMLTGELPIGRFASPSSKSGIDERVDSVVFKTLEKAPADRYQDASSVKSDVENLSSEPPPVPGIDFPIEPPAAPISDPPSEVSTFSDEKPRLSRRAVIGAVWALLALPITLAAPFLYLTPVSTTVSTISSTQWQAGSMMPIAQASQTVMNYPIIAIGIILLALGLPSVIGTPILGRLAIRDIHHSNGKLFGLRLAVADVLIFPVLIADWLIVILLALAAKIASPALVHANASFNRVAPVLMLLFGLALIAVVDFLIIRWGWRRYRLPGH